MSRFCLISRLMEAVSLLERLPDLCTMIVSAILEFTAAENCSIMLIDPETKSLNMVVAKGRGDVGSFFGADDLATTVFARGEGAAGWAAEHAQILSIDDCESDSRFVKLDSAIKTVSSMICAPIIADGSVIGVINCSHPKKERLSEFDRNNVALVADQSAILLQKANVIDKLKKDLREDKKQFDTKMIQLSKTEETLSDIQEQLYRSEKFATLGELLAGVAHELNNRVAPILIYSQMLQEQTFEGKDAKRLRIIEESAMGAKAILETLLSYSRFGVQERGPVNLNHTLQNTMMLTEYKLKNQGIEVALELCPELPPTTVNEKQIAQVFLNVVNNAISVMEASGGKLAIKSSYDRRNIIFTFSDSGPGVPEDISQKIFDPFFTTKECGKGTGLGLSISKRYIEDHGGRIYVKPNSSAGATFVIEIPRTEARLENRGQNPRPKGHAQSPARILVVEDDATICDVIRDVLGPRYEIEFAIDGREAMKKISAASFDLLVVDYHMPGLDGKQLYEWIVQNYPHLKRQVIFSTGDIYREDIRQFISGTGCQSLTKPFSTIDLRELIAGMLRG